MISIKRNDNNRQITDTLTFGGVAQDLSGATVQFVMKSISGAAVPISIKDEAIIEDEAAGEVSYELSDTQTATAGKYRFEWEVTFGDGSVTTFPSGDYGELTILEDLG